MRLLWLDNESTAGEAPAWFWEKEKQESLKHLHTVLILAVAAAVLAVAPCATQASWSFVMFDDSRSAFGFESPGNAYPSDPGGTSSPFYDGTTRVSPLFTSVVAAIAKDSTPIDFVLFPGDLICGCPQPTSSQYASILQGWSQMMSPLTSKGIPVYTLRGNQEILPGVNGAAGNSDAANVWRQNMPIPTANSMTLDTNGAGTINDQTGLSYAFTHKGSLFIGLDQFATAADGTTYSADMAFLNSQLAVPANLRFVFQHAPIGDNNVSEQPSDAAAMEAALNDKAIADFSAHDHSYQRYAKAGYSFSQYVVGTAAAPQASPNTTNTNGQVLEAAIGGNAADSGPDGPNLGYLVVTVNDDNTITTQFKELTEFLNPNSSVYSFDQVTVPEPSSTVLMLLGGTVVARWWRWRRQHVA